MRDKHKITIEKQNCIKCGLCVKDCPMKVIAMTDDGADVTRENCLMCGHCLAICPKNCVNISGFEDEPISIDETKKIDPEEFLLHMKSRRSVRIFREQQVSDEMIMKIIAAGQYSPTGTNKQTVSYIVLQNDLEKYEKIAIEKLKKLLKMIGLVNKKYANIKMGENYLFKKAPLVIAIKCDDVVDGTIAAGSMEIMANALGLGVFYSGMFSRAVNQSTVLKQMLEVKGKEKIVTTLVIGHPDVKYLRTAPREKANVLFK